MLIVAGIYIAMSFVTFIVYAKDKRAAVLGQWRTPERTLHALEFCCGWPGALLAQRLLRHKTRDTRFLLSFWLIVVLHGAMWGFFAWDSIRDAIL